MRVVEVFKAESEEERRKAVTGILIQYEAVRRGESKARRPLQTG